MASQPYFDTTNHTWCVKWKSAQGWRKETLLKVTSHQAGHPAPRRVPARVREMVKLYEERELQAKHGMAQGEPSQKTLADFLADHHQRMQSTYRPQSMIVLERATRDFVVFCAKRRIERVAEVDVAACRDWVAARLATYAIRTVRARRSLLAVAWAQAVEEGRLTENPWPRAKVKARPSQEQTPFWTHEEFARLVQAAPDWLKPILIVGVNSGIRISALLDLRWSDINLDARKIRVCGDNDKGGKGYDAPLMPKTEKVLRDMSAWPHSCWSDHRLFVGPTLQPLERTSVHHCIQRAIEKAGLPEKGTCHLLRHTFASWAVMRGVPLAVVQKWLGHASIHMTMRYVHLSDQDNKAWMEKFSVL